MKLVHTALLLLTGNLSSLIAAEVDFAHEIAPLLKEHCGQCHAGPQKKGGLSINLRETLIVGGESGSAVKVGDRASSELFSRIASTDASVRMPPEGEPLTAAQIELVGRWIDEGLKWEPGFSFGPRIYEPPLKPRKPQLPPATKGREHPLDRLLDKSLAENGLSPLPAVDDGAFLRRASLDLIGLLPTPEELDRFKKDASPDKRMRLVRELLARDIDYAEHWLTFWNDLLRNDYTGTGFITQGRKQISKWLYEALITNKPYDDFARELIAPPTPESAGFGDGIRWRGEVSAGQTVEIQFAQSVGQAFLGINLKCASCHDSFIDRWTLDDAYGLAAIYSEQPLELHRCDKPIGKPARAAWLFPELGQVDPDATRGERLQQLASLMTHRDNGRFTRNVVNRLWHRLMGRGIVHPLDAMQSEPWNTDLIDYLAEYLVEQDYDLKKVLELIATSQAYQSRTERVTEETDAHGYHYAGPRSKRLTAEQFIDGVWQLTGTAPTSFDAPIVRGKPDPSAASQMPASGQWIWNRPDVGEAPAGETVVFRRQWNLSIVPEQAVAVISCDNSYTFYVNGKQLQAGDNWEVPDLVALTNLKQGDNQLLIVALNAGNSANPAGLYFEARWTNPAGLPEGLVSDASWEWTRQQPDKKGKFAKSPEDWQPALAANNQNLWMNRVGDRLALLLSRGNAAAGLMVRNSLTKSDFLTRSLGRPMREQIVSVRPLELTTLQAIDLSNGEALASLLRKGAEQLHQRDWKSINEFLDWTFRFALSREPSSLERQTLLASIGDELTAQAIEDVLWAVIMLPEFQLVR